MRFLLVSLCFAAMFFGGEIQARNLKDMDKPMLLDAGDSKRMEVIFNHSTHKTVACAQCHHEGLPGNRYAPCANKECHAIAAPSSRDALSVYMAYHAPDTKRSCYGCHKPLAGKYPGFRGCAPCHQTPTGRKITAETRKKAEAAQ